MYRGSVARRRRGSAAPRHHNSNRPQPVKAQCHVAIQVRGQQSASRAKSHHAIRTDGGAWSRAANGSAAPTRTASSDATPLSRTQGSVAYARANTPPHHAGARRPDDLLTSASGAQLCRDPASTWAVRDVRGAVEAAPRDKAEEPSRRFTEIGAGTGFTAALLRDRVGPSGRVVSIEVDPSLAATARKRLKDAGVDAEVIAADGLKPSVLDGPFDRIHVTCAVRGAVPAAWIRLCPTGKIMMPWTPTFTHAADYVTTLDVHDGIAMGRFRYPVAFMKARSQRRTPWSEWPEGGETRAYESRLSPGELGAPLGNAGEFVVGLLLPGMEHYTTGVHPSDGERVLWLRHGDRFASLGFGAGISVNVAGDDGLVADYIAAVEWWMNHGWPDPEGFGLMVRARDDCSDATAVWHATPGVLVSARSH
ncbi:methyltransferase domain-containing protein [Streptodolium elevatio]